MTCVLATSVPVLVALYPARCSVPDLKSPASSGSDDAGGNRSGRQRQDVSLPQNFAEHQMVVADTGVPEARGGLAAYSRARVVRGVASNRLVSEAVTPGISLMRRNMVSRSARLPVPNSTTRSHLPLVVWTAEISG